MSFESGLREELNNVSGLSNQIFPVIAPEGAPTPYLVYESSEGLNDKTLTGFLSSKTIDCGLNIVCSSYSSLKTITPGVILRLQSFLGRAIGTSGIVVQNLTFEGEPHEMYDSESKLYRCIIEFTARI